MAPHRSSLLCELCFPAAQPARIQGCQAEAIHLHARIQKLQAGAMSQITNARDAQTNYTSRYNLGRKAGPMMLQQGF